MQERQPIRIFVGPQRRFVHEPAHGEVRQQQAPELLAHQVWDLAAQHDLRPAQLRLQNRWKQVIGDELRAHTDERRAEAVKVPPAKPVEYGWRGPRWRSPSMRSTACWTSDAQATSASPDVRPRFERLAWLR